MENKNIQAHTHNGLDTPKIKFEDLEIFGEDTIADPSGGATVDSQSRTAIIAILDLLASKGLMK